MKHYKSKKSLPSSLITFFVAVFILLLILLVGKIGWLGKDLSAAVAAQVRTLFASDSGAVLTLPRVLTAVAALAITYIICFILTFLSEFLARTDRGKTIKSLTSSVIRYLGVILGAVWAMSILGMNPTAVFASLGIVALIVGFGAQSLI